MSDCYGSGTGTARGYAVEIRTTFTEGQIHPSGFLIERDWKRFPVQIVKCERIEHHNDYMSGKVGDIPVHNYCHELDNLNLLNFEAAYALAVQLQLGGRLTCLQTRLVEVEVRYSYSANEVATGQPMSLDTLGREWRNSKTKLSSPAASKPQDAGKGE